MKDSAGVDFGERVLQVLRHADFFERLVGELFGEDAAQLLAIAFSGEVARAGGALEADDFHALWLGTAEALDSEGEAVLGIVGDGDDAAGDVAVFRPQVKQRLFRVSAYRSFPEQGFPGGSRGDLRPDSWRQSNITTSLCCYYFTVASCK